MSGVQPSSISVLFVPIPHQNDHGPSLKPLIPSLPDIYPRMHKAYFMTGSTQRNAPVYKVDEQDQDVGH